ncbi:MAG: hypothetical protein PHU85_15075 [Phycisphaerae bacterium]|nr:hypothetical protein [Phycisphaerae bacterium]
MFDRIAFPLLASLLLVCTTVLAQPAGGPKPMPRLIGPPVGVDDVNPGLDQPAPDPKAALANVTRSLGRANAVFIATVSQVATVAQTHSIPPSVLMNVTLKDPEMLKGDKPENLVFSYSAVQGRGFFPTANQKVIVAGAAMCEATDENIAAVMKAIKDGPTSQPAAPQYSPAQIKTSASQARLVLIATVESVKTTDLKMSAPIVTMAVTFKDAEILKGDKPASLTLDYWAVQGQGFFPTKDQKVVAIVNTVGGRGPDGKLLTRVVMMAPATDVNVAAAKAGTAAAPKGGPVRLDPNAPLQGQGHGGGAMMPGNGAGGVTIIMPVQPVAQAPFEGPKRMGGGPVLAPGGPAAGNPNPPVAATSQPAAPPPGQATGFPQGEGPIMPADPGPPQGQGDIRVAPVAPRFTRPPVRVGPAIAPIAPLPDEAAPAPGPAGVAPAPADPKATLVAAIATGQLVFTAKVDKLVEGPTATSEPPILSWTVTFKDVDVLKGAKFENANFSYNVRRGSGLEPKTDQKVLVVSGPVPASQAELPNRAPAVGPGMARPHFVIARPIGAAGPRIILMVQQTDENVALAKKSIADSDKPGVVANDGQWTALFSGEQWYKTQTTAEQEFSGTLTAVPQAGGASTLQRSSYYRLGNRNIYTGAKKVDALDKLVGKKVTVRGKPYDINLEGQSVTEIWPGAVRVDDAKGDTPKPAPAPAPGLD